SRGASRRSSASRQRTANWIKRSGEAWWRSYSRKGVRTVTVWCSRWNW
ncbi:RHS repeat protein, partial [Escherichia coli]|nr:RHS repeat protein [Escherichia coli]